MSEVEKKQPEKDRGGVWVLMGGTEYKVPPLNFAAVKQLMPKIEALGAMAKGGAPAPDQMATIIEVAHTALVRNYPSMTLAEVDDIVDLSNFTTVFNAIMGTSGLLRKEGDLTPGEAPPSR